MHKLYDYQREMRRRILEALGKHSAVMCQMPTGTGKTHVLAAVVNDYAKSKLVWVVAHRKELIEQIIRTWEKFYEGRKNAPRVKVMSIQWLAGNWEKVKDDRPAMIVIDEAHHTPAETYRELFRRYPDTKKLGMTATPYRLSGKGFDDLYEVLLQSKSVIEFIMMKRLSLFDYYTVPQNSKIRKQIALMSKRGADGDYRTKEMELSLNTPRHIEYLYNSLMRYAPGRRGIVYAININHARAIADFYTSKGLKCCAIDCMTPAKEREAKIEGLRNGEIDVMVNVDIFSEGFDCPEVEFIQLARPTLSLAVYLQQVGRGLRKAKGKKKCIILDNAALSHTFGTPLRQWQWSGMFHGNGGNQRLDERDAKELRKQLAYPGKLVDEPMDKIISHTDLDTGVRYSDILEFTPGERLVGIRINGKVAARMRVQSLAGYHDGIVAVRLDDGTVRILLPDKEQIKVSSDFRSFELTGDSVLKITLSTGYIYRDLITGREFDKAPRILKAGPMEFIGDEKIMHLRSKKISFSFKSRNVNEACWRGFYFMAYDDCHAKEYAYIPMKETISRFDYKQALHVIFPGNSYVYYFVGELPDGSILVTTHSGDYYHVTPTLLWTRVLSSHSYMEAKTWADEWLKAYGGSTHYRIL